MAESEREALTAPAEDKPASKPRRKHPGRCSARSRQPLHPDRAQPHPYRLRRQPGKITYPHAMRSVNHAVARTHTKERPVQTTIASDKDGAFDLSAPTARKDRIVVDEADDRRALSYPLHMRAQLPYILAGPVAQRLEQGTHNPLVGGTNPPGPPKHGNTTLFF